MADNNLLSYNGPHDNNRAVVLNETVYGEGYDDAIKLTTKLENFDLEAGIVEGGSEDVVDINNESHHIDVSIAGWKSNGQYNATIKGGSHDIRLNGLIITHGKKVDVDLGNWSDQSDKKTYNIELALRSIGGRKIKVRVLKADKPTFINSDVNYEYAFPSPNNPLHGFFVWSFFTGLGLYKKVAKLFKKN